MPNDVQSVDEVLAVDPSGQREAFDQLFDRLYGDLRELAHVQRRFRHPAETLNTTALVNELYCKLAELGAQGWKDRDHFYAACATSMRHLLVDAARWRLREKRGGGQRLLPLDEGCVAAEGDPEFIVELDRLMVDLAEHDSRLVNVFECRYFGGFTVSETARILSLSERTVERDWARARGWFRLALKDGSGQAGK
jgi:RNA polymerase sigma factor (TIGR02999 family)